MIYSISMHPLERLKLVPVILLLILIGVSPFIFAFLTSFSHDVYGERSFAGVENYRFLLSDRGFRYSFSITAAWSIVTTLLTVGVAFFLATQMVSSKNIYSKFVYGALLIPWGIPVYIGVPLWRGIIHGNGGESLISTLFGMEINLLTDNVSAFFSTVFVHLWLAIPVTTFVFVGALRKVPNNLIETARIDGGHRGIVIRHIYFPAIKNTLMAMSALLFVSALKEFTLVYLMTSGGPPLVSGITDRSIIGATTTLGVFLYEIFGETADFGISSAYAVFLMGFVIIILFFWLFARGKLKNTNIPIFLVAVLQPLLGGWVGIIFGILYCTAILRKRFYLYVFYAQIAVTLVLVISQGFLKGFQGGLIVSVLMLLLLLKGSDLSGSKRTKKENKRFPEAQSTRFFPVILPPLIIISSLVLLFFLTMLSVSEGNVITFDSLSGRIKGFGNFIQLFSETGLHRYFFNTIFLSATAAVITPLICFPAASYLVHKGKRHVALFLLGIQVLSVGGGIHTLLPLYAQFIRLGMGGSYIPLVLIYCYHAVPFSLFTMTAYLEKHPKSLKDQAQIDGAGPLQYLWRIQVPVSIPVITTTAMITFMNGWNSFLAPLLFINDESKFTISVKLFSLIGNLGSSNPQWNLFAAASVINLAIIALIFGPLQRPLQSTALRDIDD